MDLGTTALPRDGSYGAWDAEALHCHLEVQADARVDSSCKGLPPSYRGSFRDIATAGLALGKSNLPMPVAFLKQSALRTNREWMRRFLERSGAVIAPHGKSTMTPALFEMQLQDGAWAMTAATAQHVAFYAALGIRRVILANQLVGEGNTGIIVTLLRDNPAIDFYCLVDSAENARQLAVAARASGLTRPLQVLVEIGAQGGRTGMRGIAAALQLARDIHALRPMLSLRGVEAYEGVFGGLPPAEKEERVRDLLREMGELATACDAAALFDPGPVILTAGGTEFFDLAGLGLTQWDSTREHLVVIRSGCYLTHDDLAYERAYQRLLRRSPELDGIAPQMTAALEVWAVIQSSPEPGLAFATLGKRDISFDFEMPVPLKWLRPGDGELPKGLPQGHCVTRLNDQHAYLALPPGSPLRVGDLVGFGVSHICTTFDKWKTLLLVDDDYQVTGAVRTFF